MGFPCAERFDAVGMEGVGSTGVAGTLVVVEVVEDVGMWVSSFIIFC